MKKHIFLTLIFLTGTTLQMYAPRPFEPVIDSHASEITATHTQEAQAKADAAKIAQAQKLTLDDVNRLSNSMKTHDIVAQVNSEFGGIKLQDQANLASAIDKALRGDSYGVENLNTLLISLAEKYNPNQNKPFNSKEYLTGLKKEEEGKSFSDQITSAFNYIKLKFSHAVNAISPNGAKINPSDISNQLNIPDSGTTLKKIDDATSLVLMQPDARYNVAHIVANNASIANVIKASFDANTGAILKINSTATSADIITALSANLAARETPVQLTRAQKSALEGALSKARSFNSAWNIRSKDTYYKIFSDLLGSILQPHNILLNQKDLSDIIQKAEATSSLLSRFNSIKIKTTTDSTPKPSLDILNGFVYPTPNIPAIKILHEASTTQEGFIQPKPEPKIDTSTIQSSNSATPEHLEIHADNTSASLHDKTEATFDRSSTSPAKMPEGLEIVNGYSARLVDETGAVKATFNIDSIVSGLITSINSSAHPINIARTISAILVASSKSGKKITPFSATEISTLGSYMNQMKNPTYAAQIQSNTANVGLKMVGLRTTDLPDLQKMAVDSFNDYLSDLLNTRLTTLNQKQLLEAIKKAEETSRNIVNDTANTLNMNTVTASLPYISESRKATETPKGIINNVKNAAFAHIGLTSSPYQAPITLSSPIPMLPEKVPGVSSLDDFGRFRVALTASLTSINPTEAKALITKLIGSSQTEYVHKPSATLGQKIAIKASEIAMATIQPHLDSFGKNLQKGALSHEAGQLENPVSQLVGQAAAHPVGKAAAQLIGQVGGNTLSQLGGQLVGHLTGNSESTYLSTFLSELSNSPHITDLTANTEAQLNAFLQKISSDPYHPIKLTDENFSQISRNLISMFNETFKPILDAEESTQGGLTNETRKNEQRNYKKFILSNLETKPVTDPTSLAKFSDKIFTDFKLICENPKTGILTSGLSATAIVTNLLTNTFSNEPRSLAFDAMAILLAPADGSLATQENVFNTMNLLNKFLSTPTFNPENELLINNILINLNSKLKLTKENSANISSSLASLKPIILAAHFEPEFNPFPSKKIPSDSIEKQSSKAVNSLASSIPSNAKELQRIPAIKDILTKFYTTTFSGTQSSKAELRVQILNNLMATRTEINNISNLDARNELISNITILKTFLETPNSTEGSQNNDIINNILRNLKISITLTSTNFQLISESLSPLKPLLDTALTYLNKPIPSTTLLPVAAIKPTESPAEAPSVKQATITSIKPTEVATPDTAALKKEADKVISGAKYAANTAKAIVNDPENGAKNAAADARAAGNKTIAEKVEAAAKKALDAADNAQAAAQAADTNPTQDTIAAANEAMKQVLIANKAVSKAIGQVYDPEAQIPIPEIKPSPKSPITTNSPSSSSGTSDPSLGWN